jgi:hypothetical protein
MADRGMFSTSELRPLLAARSIDLPDSQSNIKTHDRFPSPHVVDSMLSCRVLRLIGIGAESIVVVVEESAGHRNTSPFTASIHDSAPVWARHAPPIGRHPARALLDAGVRARRTAVPVQARR